MLRVLIADDDMVVRTNLKTMIDWERHGFEIYDEATNGVEAIQKLEKGNCNIVITDMSMPIMDGVAVIESIRKYYPSVKVIALSGYDDFDYVRKSLKYGAVDYILKHKLNEESLLNVLKLAQSLIAAEQENFEQNQKQQEQLYRGKSVLVQSFVNNLVKGQITVKEDIERKIEELNICIGRNNLVVVAAEIDSYYMLKDQNTDILTQSFISIADEVLKDLHKALVSHAGDGRFVIIVDLGKTYSYLYIHNQLVEIINRIKASVKRFLGVTTSFGLSSVCNDISDMSRFYSEAERALRNKFYAGKDQILWKNSNEDTKDNFMSLNIKDEMAIRELLKSINREKVIHFLNELFDKIVKCNANYKSVQMICAELVSIANMVCREFGINDLFVNLNESIPFDMLKKFDTIDEVKHWLFEVYDRLLTLLEKARVNSVISDYTKKAIEFIQLNFHKNISLMDAAKHAGVSMQYLSKLFKEECGMGFVDYLNKVRVDRAKVLIESGDKKLKDIISMAGFNNYNYFFKVFKEITGVTPTEYERVYRDMHE